MGKVLTVIPARGGSKGVPRKNLKILGGKPLIAHTIAAALSVFSKEDVIVSTDDEEIAEVSEACGASVPFIRPSELATDSATSEPVVRHALLHAEEAYSITYDAVLMLQPTSPLRSADDIRRAIDLYEHEEGDSVVSVVDVQGDHPFRMKRIVGKRLVNYIDQGFWDLRARQLLPPVYIRSGSIYLVERDVFLEHRSLIGKEPLALIMDSASSVNIDSYIDFKVAELLASERASDS